jgi:hypothetical protein
VPAPILHLGASVLCSHAGQATPLSPTPRVLLSGQPAVTLVSPYSVAGCSLPSNAGGPCITGNWLSGAVRVLANGAPVLLMTGSSTCVPTGTPLLPVSAQTRVMGT